MFIALMRFVPPHNESDSVAIATKRSCELLVRRPPSLCMRPSGLHRSSSRDCSRRSRRAAAAAAVLAALQRTGISLFAFVFLCFRPGSLSCLTFHRLRFFCGSCFMFIGLLTCFRTWEIVLFKISSVAFLLRLMFHTHSFLFRGSRYMFIGCAIVSLAFCFAVVLNRNAWRLGTVSVSGGSRRACSTP